MTALIKTKWHYSLLFLLLLSSEIVFSQNIKPARFKDYPLVQNLDSLDKAVHAQTNNPEQYLHGLITLEKNRIDYTGWFGKDLTTIKTLAYKLHSPLAIASYQYLQGLYIRDNSVNSAIRNILEAVRYFESAKDTVGMIQTYYAMLLINRFGEGYTVNKVQSRLFYFDKIINLSQNSNDIQTQIVRINTICHFEKQAKGKQDYNERIKEVEAMEHFLTESPNTNTSYAYSCSGISNFYWRHNLLQKGLECQLKSLGMYKKSSSKIFIKIYLNVGIAYSNIEAYKESESVLLEGIQAMEQLKEEDKNKGLLQILYAALADVQFSQKKYEMAWASRQKSTAILNWQKHRLESNVFQELQTQYDIDQKEHENALLKKKNELAELMNQQILKDAEINSLSQKNQLTESQNQRYQKELENNVLVQKNQATESRNTQYKTAFGIGSVSFIIVCILVYFLYRANEKQKKLILFRDQLFGIIAHDMRSPLTAFRSVSESLNFLLRKGEYQSIPPLSKSIDQSIFNANLLLDNLLDWYALQNPNTKTTKSVFSVYELVKESKDLYETVAKNQQSSIDIAVPDSLYILADRNALLLILRNLIDNALKHGQSKNIMVKAYKEANYIAVEVKNNGTILSPRKLSVLQQQIKQSSVVTKEGRGLGLYLVAHFVAQHNGQLTIHSSEEDGTIFKIQIPIAD